MANVVGSVQIDIEARMARLESDVGRAARVLERELARGAAAAENRFNQMQARITRELDKIQKAGESVGRLFVSYFSVQAIRAFTMQLANTADIYSNIQAKVRLATQDQGSLADATGKVYEVAQRTYGSFEATTALVQRTAGALRNAGQEAVTAFDTGVRLSEVFNKSLVVSGASATEAASAAMQFSQALASGKFQGDEFRSVMENNSRFAQLLADSLGVTTAKLREMSTAGKLNIQSMFGVLQHTEKLDAEFSRMPVTIGRAMTQLSNAWTKFIGEADQASGASRKVAESIQAIGRNLPQIASALISLGEIALTVFVSKIAASAVAAGRAIMASAAQAVAAETIWRSTTAAATGASTAMAGLAVAGRGLLAMVGGIPGLFIAGAAALVYFATRATDASKEIERLGHQSEAASARVLTLHDALSVLATGAERPKKTFLELAEAQLKQAEAELFAASQSAGASDRFLAMSARVEKMREEVEKLREAESTLRFENLKAQLSDTIRWFGQGIDAIRNWRRTLSGSIAVDSDLEKEAAELEKHATQIGRTKAEYYELVKAKELDAAASKFNAKEGSEAYKILQEAADKKYAHILKAASAEDAATTSMKSHRTEVRELAKEETTAESAAEKYNNAMERLADLGDKSAKSLGAVSKIEGEHAIRLRNIAEAADDARAASDKQFEAEKRHAQLVHSTTLAAKAAVDLKVREAAIRATVAEKVGIENRAYAQQVIELKRTADIAGPILQRLREQATGAWLSERDSSAAQAVAELRGEYAQLGEEARGLVGDMGALEKAVADQALATYDAQKAAQFWQSTWDNAVDGVSRAIGDFAVRNIKTWKDFGRAMLDVVKQTVASIITEFAKTKILQFFAGTGGGGGGSFWGSLAAMGASMLSSSGGGGGGGSSASGGGSAQGTGGFQYQGASGGGGIGLDTMQTLYKGYKMLFGGGGTGYAGSAAYANAAMYGPPADMAPGFMGPPAAYSTPGPYGSMGGYGTAAAWGGGLLGAMYGYRRGDGSVLGTGGSTVAYGALGMGIAGTAAGMAGGLSAGAAAGGAFSAIGAMSWIPIVGWIAAIAAVVDKVSGGKVFGTKYRPETATTTVALGQDGATINASLVEWKYRNQASQAFGRIGGALLPSDWGDKDHRVTQIAITPEMQRAADAFFKSISQVMIKVAKATGDETASMIDAALIVRQEFDKKGKLKKTHYIAEIFGKQYEEETAELAQIRIQAEAAIAQLQVNSIASGASAIAEKYRGSAEALLDVSATMTQATSDIVHGVKLLAGGDTLESIMEYVEGIQQAGEAVSQTYMRLAEASKQYQSIMAQITDALDAIRTGDSPSRRMEQSIKAWEEQTKATVDQLNAAAEAAGLMGAKEEDLAKARELSVAQLGKMTTDFFGGIDAQILGIDGHATPASDFAAAMRGIDVQLNENIKIANSLARAAGLSGASEQQLAKIHELAARQAAAAIRQLENVGRQQARSLYGGANTLQDVEADIAALEADMQAASTSLGDFSGAITDVADAASAAMRLLLGDLSPLNDQQKLQTALGGLSAGTASREDVLTIGRRLYASSAAYTALFNQVMAMPDKVAQATGGGPGGGTSSTSRQYHGTATLAELYEKRDAMNAAQRINEARDLAETVAALAKSKDETFEQIAAELGFSLDDLAKDLGLSYEGLQDYLGKIDVNASAVADSFTENMDRLLAKLDEIFGTGPQFTPIDEGEVPVGSESDGTVPRHFQDLPNGEAHIQQMTETTEMVGRMTRDAIADMAQAFREMAQAQREISQFNMPRGIREGGGVLVR